MYLPQEGEMVEIVKVVCDGSVCSYQISIFHAVSLIFFVASVGLGAAGIWFSGLSK